MTHPLAEKEQRVANRLLLVASLDERFSAVEQMGTATRAMPTGEVVTTFDVPECSSGLRVTVIRDGDAMRFFPEATVPLVRGLARVVCMVYDGESADSIAGFTTQVLEKAGVWELVSPIRQAGVAAMVRRIQTINV